MKKSITIILCFSIVLLMGGCILVPTSQEKCIVNIDGSFVGPAMIVFNQKDGESFQRKNGNVILDLPSSGVLRTTNIPNSGSCEFEFYFVDKTGKRAKVDRPQGNEDEAKLYEIECVSEQYFGTMIFDDSVQTTGGSYRIASFLVKPKETEVKCQDVEDWMSKEVRKFNGRLNQ